jgi:hypothetical protein
MLVLALAVTLAAASACGRKNDLILPGTVLPEAVSGLSAESSEDGIILVWTMPGRNTAGQPLTDLTGFDVLRAEIPEGQDGCPCLFAKVGYIDLEYPLNAVVKGDKAAWTDRASGLSPGVMYAYKVVGVNKDGYPGRESNTSAARLLTPFTTPTDLVAASGNRAVTLSWKPVLTAETASMFKDLIGFNVYRTLKPEGPPLAPLNMEPLMGGGYVDRGVKNGETYYYRITALRGSEKPYTEGVPTGWVTATPSDTQPPAPPAGLQAVPDAGVVLLSWEPDMDEVISGYRLYRKGPEDKELTPVSPRPSRLITYKDTDVRPGASYTYAVSALDDAVPPNESGMSLTVTVTVNAP